MLETVWIGPLNRGCLIQFQIDIQKDQLRNFQYPLNPKFGVERTPVTLWFDLTHENVVPEMVHIATETEFNISCFSSVLHYGQSIFEGMKAYWLGDGKVGVFRLYDHAARFKKSAQIMGMPAFSEEVFKECILKFVECSREIIPQEEGHSLYLRPLMIANDPVIKVTSGHQFRFILMATIAGNYFNSGVQGAKVFCNRHFVRAFPQGTGEAKTSSNYAQSLPSLQYAQTQDFDQVLYLNSLDRENIDELGGMNFFMIRGKQIVTPSLGGTILSGITRASLLEVAKNLSLEAVERPISLKEITDHCDEIGIFASGTAATVVPISVLGVQEQVGGDIQNYHFKIDPITEELRRQLVQCQRNKNPLSKKWLTIV